VSCQSADSLPFPTRRSSDLVALPDDERRVFAFMSEQKRKGRWSVPRVLKVLAVMSDVKLDFRHTDIPHGFTMDVQCIMAQVTIIDRKSTRLNSSHVKISYAV